MRNQRENTAKDAGTLTGSQPQHDQRQKTKQRQAKRSEPRSQKLCFLFLFGDRVESTNATHPLGVIEFQRNSLEAALIPIIIITNPGR